MEFFSEKTIVAIATPSGRGAVGMVRLSGPRAHDLLKEVFRSHKKKRLLSHTLIHGAIFKNNEVLDDVLACVMPQTGSYTGENVAEIHTHGNPLILADIVDLLISKGATMAAPGEFTFRAFMNGKIDLTQAEAVADLISAKSTKARSVATRQLSGVFSNKIKELRAGILEVLAHTEAAIDFSTEDIDVLNAPELQKKILLIKEKIVGMLASYVNSRRLKEGVSVALVGRPNVGKSSLLNALIDQERAIVTDEPGTTRDTVEEEWEMKGVCFRFIDTAGIRKAATKAEQLGIDRSAKKINTADCVVLLLDQSQPLQADDFSLWDQLQAKTYIVGINKTDLPAAWNLFEVKPPFSTETAIGISATQKKGLKDLTEAIYEKTIDEECLSGDLLVTNIRHKSALEAAEKHLVSYEQGLSNKTSLEFLALDLREAVVHVEAIIGNVSTDDVYDKIFSTFCIGK